MTSQARYGPIEGHWMTTLSLVESKNDGKDFLCLICKREDGVSDDKATFRSENTASNMYSHIRCRHPSVYDVLRPIIDGRKHNKRQCLPEPGKMSQTTIATSNGRGKQSRFDEALLRYFAGPDVPKNTIEYKRFKDVVLAANPCLRIATTKTLNARLWCRFNETIEVISRDASAAEFLTLMFDGWSTSRNEAVLGFMASMLDKNTLQLRTRCVGNFRLPKGHGAVELSRVIGNVVAQRLGKRVPNFFLSDSAPVNKAAVRLYMLNKDGDDFWFPCSVHFMQLAMREAVECFLNGSCTRSLGNSSLAEADWDDLGEEEILENARSAAASSAFDRLTTTCRAVRAAIKHSHARNDAFRRTQVSLGITTTIKNDVKTRFDSTVEMFDSVLRNRAVLQRMQEEGRRDPKSWPAILHFSAEDFETIQSIVGILEPVRFATKELSRSNSRVGDVIPVFTSTIDAIGNTSAGSGASKLKNELIKSLACRLGFLLDCDMSRLLRAVKKFDDVYPNEFVVAAYLNPRYTGAMSSVYGFAKEKLVAELERVYADRISTDGENTTEEVEEVPEKSSAEVSESQSEHRGFNLQSWAERFSKSPSTSRSSTTEDHTISEEVEEFFSEVTRKTFSDHDSLLFWIQAKKMGRYPRLCKLARLFLTIPASAIPQERHFSELKRRCAGLRASTKVETLDRDGVVFAWLDDERQ